jgi:isocitrate/isopropylmalate dehydrogenase
MTEDTPMELLILPGDGIGPEITAATIHVLSHLESRMDLPVRITIQQVGLEALRTHGTTAPDGLVETARKADGIVLGPLALASYPPVADRGINVSALLRKELDLFANIRPSRARPGVEAVAPGMDVVIVRENSEGFYADRNMFSGAGEFMPTADVALALRKVTATASHRIAVAAFELAERRRRRVTSVHKATTLPLSDGLFLREAERVSHRFPAVTYGSQLVDSMAARLVDDYSGLDVILTTNMFGDILSDLAAALTGGLGLAGAINVGDTHCMAQAQHGCAPSIAGRGIANPSSLLLSVAMLLDWFGRQNDEPVFSRVAEALDSAVDSLVANPQTRTVDLGGQCSTQQFAAAVCAALDETLAA